jgi:hypothetical protein
MSLSEATQAKLAMSLDDLGGGSRGRGGGRGSEAATQAKLDMSLDDLSGGGGGRGKGSGGGGRGKGSGSGGGSGAQKRNANAHGTRQEGFPVYVGNLPWSISWRELKDHMSTAGNVLFCDVKTGDDGRSRGFGFCNFATQRDAMNAVNNLNGTDLEGREIVVRLDGERGGGKGKGAGSDPNQSVFDRIGGGKSQGKSAMSALAEWRTHLTTAKDEDGADVTLFYDHPIVRITASDIQLDTGGSRTKETLTAMNEALHAHTFRVSIKGEEWYVSDGKLRMVRLVDGIVITGAATEKREAPMMAAAAAPGPVRVVRPGGRGQRYAPY